LGCRGRGPAEPMIAVGGGRPWGALDGEKTGWVGVRRFCLLLGGPRHRGYKGCFDWGLNPVNGADTTGRFARVLVWDLGGAIPACRFGKRLGACGGEKQPGRFSFWGSFQKLKNGPTPAKTLFSFLSSKGGKLLYFFRGRYAGQPKGLLCTTTLFRGRVDARWGRVFAGANGQRGCGKNAFLENPQQIRLSPKTTGRPLGPDLRFSIFQR